MWLQFGIAVIVMVAVLIIPGYLLLRAFGMPRAWAVCSAPLLSVSLICIVGQLLVWMGVAGSPATVLLPIVVIAGVATLASRKYVAPINLPRMAWWVPALFVGLGLVLGFNLFVSRLGGQLDSFLESYDLTKHVDLIQAFTDSGHFSSIGTSAYLTSADAAINPVSDIGFYPSAWHILCALVVQATGATTALVINVSMYVFSSIVYPLAMAALLSLVFRGRRKYVLLGGIAALSFVAFPWALLAFGPIYPNVAGFSVVPITIWLFMRIVAPDTSKGERIRLGILLLVALVGQALLHPNTLFTAAVLLIPYCAHVIWRVTRPPAAHAAALSANLDSSSEKDEAPSPLGRLSAWISPRRRQLLLTALFLVACAVIWCVCYRLPMFQATIEHNWPHFASYVQELVNILTLSYTYHFFYEIAAQFLLAAFVIIGLVRSLHSDKFRWCGLTYLLCCLICFIPATREGFLKHLVAGFWYTDPMRLAAMAAIAAVPLAVLGMAWMYDRIQNVARRYNDAHEKKTHVVKIGIAYVAVVLVVNFMPSFYLPGLHEEKNPRELTEENVKAGQREVSTTETSLDDYSVHTTFGDYRSIVSTFYKGGAPFTAQEKAFVAQVDATVEPGALVINTPMDGSFLAYGYDGLRCYYRDFVGFGGEGETSDSATIRTQLNQISYNDDVKTAVSNVGATYVLVLDDSDSENTFINLRDDYRPDLFLGITSINDTTPGFEKVLEDGTMRLYKITAVS